MMLRKNVTDLEVALLCRNRDTDGCNTCANRIIREREVGTLFSTLFNWERRVSPLPGGLWPPSSSSGWAAFHSSALWISGGMGGAVGMWEPCTWKPFSSANHVMLTCWPSGATYESDPCETTGVSCSTCFGWPDSWWLIPLLVSKLRDKRSRDILVIIISGKCF